ncbi:hypothetical protein [Acinetobacter sp. TGL-Y2]|uniref:hypothetical protein n=1 Tax=Acinetobacter sp. TGL-Y2 TaxID=1407071 RepID=UPI0012379E7D|nr:hypothetical protein [Acinetobacter sp. TGL-Y2]
MFIGNERRMIASHLNSSFCLESMFHDEVYQLVQFPVFTTKADFLKYLLNSGWKFEILVPDLTIFVDLLIVNNRWVHGGYGTTSDETNNNSESDENRIYFRLSKIEKEVYAIKEL